MLLAEDVASKFLEFSMRDAKYITPLKLQKLLKLLVVQNLSKRLLKAFRVQELQLKRKLFLKE